MLCGHRCMTAGRVQMAMAAFVQYYSRIHGCSKHSFSNGEFFILSLHGNKSVEIFSELCSKFCFSISFEKTLPFIFIFWRRFSICGSLKYEY